MDRITRFFRNQILDFKPRAKHFIELLHHFYVIAAIAGMAIAAIRHDWSATEFVFICALLIYFLFILIFLIVSAAHWGAKARYSESYISIHGAIHELRDIYYWLSRCIDDPSKFNSATFKHMMTNALTHVNSAFTISSAVRCRTSIKIMGPIKETHKEQTLDNYYVQTLARDMSSATEKAHDDLNEGKKHIISKNTDFRDLAEMHRDYFFEGDIWKSVHYRNTSFTNGKQGNDCYNSTIVWPIRYKFSASVAAELAQNGTATGAEGNQELYGFLTIDCKPRNAFSERYDSQMGAAIADALVPILSLYKQVNQQLKEGHKKA